MKISESIHKALTKAGGRTLGGKPLYKFAWSPEFTYLISNGTKYEPFRVVAEDCWLLLKFEPAEFWGTQEEWEQNNYESSETEKIINGVCVLGNPLLTAGPFPINGRYRNIMRIKRPVVIDGQTYLEHCAPDLQWVEQIFPDVLAFQQLSTEKKAQLLTQREKDEKGRLSKKFQASRQLYKGAATAKQVQDKEEAIERWLKNPANVALAQNLSSLTTKGTN